MLPRLGDPGEHDHTAPGSDDASELPCGGGVMRCVMTVELVQSGLHACAEAMLPAGQGQAATSNTPACNDKPRLRAEEVGVGRKVERTSDEAPRAPEDADRQSHEDVGEEIARVVANVCTPGRVDAEKGVVAVEAVGPGVRWSAFGR